MQRWAAFRWRRIRASASATKTGGECRTAGPPSPVVRPPNANSSAPGGPCHAGTGRRSEEHTSELQSLMRISYAVFCLKKKKKQNSRHITSLHVLTPIKFKIVTYN